MAGLTEDGLEVRTQPELQALLEAALEEAIPGIDVSEGPEHQVIGVLSEQLAETWELLQALYAAAYPQSASGRLLDFVSAITGTTRRAATRSRVTATVNLGAGVTLPAGSIAAVAGEPEAQFQSIEAVVNGTGSAADVEVVMEALDAGPIAAPSSTLTQIVTPVSGWNSVTNAAAAEVGRAEATDAELRAQREVELAGVGAGTLAAIRAAVARVDGVQEVEVYENATLSTDGDGRPAKSFEAVVWDGSTPAADDDELAQAVWDSKPAGILAHGATSGDATLESGDTIEVAFTRATALRVYVEATVVLEPGTGAGWADQAADAIAARGAEYSVGETLYASQVICALLEVPGVVAVITLTVGTSPSPSGSSVAADYDEIVRIATGDVDASEAP